MKSLISIIIPFILTIEGYSQRGTYINDTVTIIELHNSTLLAKLDSFIESEKNCKYYTPDLIIGIHIQLWKEGYFIYLGSDDGLGVVEDKRLIYGGFMHKGHYVDVVINPDVNISLVERFFRKTDQTKIVELYKPVNSYDPKTGLVILESIEDDSFSYWRYYYQDGEFKIFERHTYCE